MLEEKVKTALENVRPSLQADGGDVEFVSISDNGEVSVRLTGACGGCPMAAMTLKNGIENYLKKEVPEVSSVVGVE
jgi:Fe-S cluster biogenesis protein NfuA